ncbi:MAG: outer membrane protein assembly factor [Balneola sp.]|nr:outer membrane protein assembly factor [Balneola sp.]
MNQTGQDPEVDVSAKDLIRKVRFSGNSNIKDRILEGLVKTRTNREFLGIPRFTPWLYIHNLSNGRIGEDPTILDRSIVRNDLERIRLYYESLGYRDVQVDTTIVNLRESKVEVSYIVKEGTQYFIESVGYTGLPSSLTKETITHFYSQSSLTKTAINDSTFQSFKAYNATELRQEQERILSFLKNNGFASASRDSVIAFVQPGEQTHGLKVLFYVAAGRLFHFGDVNIVYRNAQDPSYKMRDFRYKINKDQVPTKLLKSEDTSSVSQQNILSSINLTKSENLLTKNKVIVDQIAITPGGVYTEIDYLQSIRELQNLGMLTIKRFGLSEFGINPDFNTDTIPVYIELESITPHRITTELFGMKRYGFGTGFGIDYNNINVNGLAERINISINSSFEFVSEETIQQITPEDQVQSSLFRSYELRGEYTLPRLARPFRYLNEITNFVSARSTYSLSYSRSDQLYFDINSDLQFNYRLEVPHSNSRLSRLDLFELDIIDTNPSSEFKNNLIDEFGQNSLEYIRILQDFEPQISSIIRYSFRDYTTNLIKRNNGYFRELSISAGGNLPYLVDRLFVTPGKLEGELPTLFKLSDNQLLYSQFVKFTMDIRRYFPLASGTILSYRLFGGIAHPFGNNTSIPLNRRFFAGGSNDIRGWAPFQLGPGTISSDQVTINGGEIKLASFVESRQVLIQNLLGADWYGGLYADAGNIWYGPRNDFRSQDNKDQLEQGRFLFSNFYKQIAVGTGTGIRIDWDYVVIRLDFTIRAHDVNSGWFNDKKLYFSFGIGHSF